MASRWNRVTPYGGGSGYIGSGVVGGVGFYMGGPPSDRRPYNPQPPAKTFYGDYRSDNFVRRPDRRDDFRGGKRGPPKGRSPIDKRYHGTPPSQRKDRPFGKRQSFGRYEVKIPKCEFNKQFLSFSDLRHRYPRLNVASDIYECMSPWVESYPVYVPMKVFHRDVDPLVPHDLSLLTPSDADYSFSARVMLMACPQEAELYKNTCQMADDQAGIEKALPTKSIHFLVGGRAKSETMALGGPWSSSMDGLDPMGNPKTLINTAIRTFKGLTGIRFMEIKYYRQPGAKAPAFTGPDEEREITIEKPEVVVFFIPVIAHMIPSESDWSQTRDYYTSVLQKLLAPEKTETDNIVEGGEVENSVDTAMEEAEESTHSDIEPTHHSKLDLNSMKVSDLRNELAARKLDTKGLKCNLVARLQSSLDEEKRSEEPEEEIKAEQTPTKIDSPIASQAKDDSKELSEKDRRRLERLYRLGDKPAIAIHPNKSAKGGRFDCHRVSLFSLLDYRTEDQKEHNFEVSLFAEQFHEMLQRDAAFTIFKAIHDAPEKEIKSEQDVKMENGIDDEPDVKRRRNNSATEEENSITDEQKIRRLRRTIDPALLFAFTYYDVGQAGYIREHDLCEILHQLGLFYSRAQMRKLISKVAPRRDHVHYHTLTDSDVVEGDDKDVVTIKIDGEDTEVLRMLALGNRALFDMNSPQVPAKILVGGGGNEEIMARLEKSEGIKQKIEFQFYQIKEELEKTRAKLNSFKDTEDQLCAQNHELSSRLKSDQRQLHEHKNLSNTYNHLLRLTRDQLERVLFDINKQFEKEKAKREAEKTAEAEKTEEANKSKTQEVEVPDKSEEKEWEVVDTV